MGIPPNISPRFRRCETVCAIILACNTVSSRSAAEAAMTSDVKVEFEHRTESHPIKLVSEYVIHDVVQAAVGCTSIASGRAPSSTGGVGARYRHTTDRSSNPSASTRPARRRDAGRFGKMPATYLLVEPPQRVVPTRSASGVRPGGSEGHQTRPVPSMGFGPAKPFTRYKWTKSSKVLSTVRLDSPPSIRPRRRPRLRYSRTGSLSHIAASAGVPRTRGQLRAARLAQTTSAPCGLVVEADADPAAVG